jgi:hypothetical protein
MAMKGAKRDIEEEKNEQEKSQSFHFPLFKTRFQTEHCGWLKPATAL